LIPASVNIIFAQNLPISVDAAQYFPDDQSNNIISFKQF
jgi:hypothetical protein